MWKGKEEGLKSVTSFLDEPLFNFFEIYPRGEIENKMQC